MFIFQTIEAPGFEDVCPKLCDLCISVSESCVGDMRSLFFRPNCLNDMSLLSIYMFTSMFYFGSEAAALILQTQTQWRKQTSM